MNKERERKIKESVLQWLDCADMPQKDLAEKLSISPPSLNHMLKGDAPFPLSRFLQTAYILAPGEAEVNRVFALYLEELEIPAEAIRIQLRQGGGIQQQDLRARIHAMVDQISDDKLPVLAPLVEMMVEKE